MSDDSSVGTYAQFPFRAIGEAPEEVHLSILGHPGAVVVPHPHLEGRPATLNFVGKLEPFVLPSPNSVSGPRLSLEHYATDDPDQALDYFKARWPFTIALMDYEGTALGDKELNCFNFIALNRLISAVTHEGKCSSRLLFLLLERRAKSLSKGDDCGLPDVHWIADQNKSRLAVNVESDFIFFKTAIPHAEQVELTVRSKDGETHTIVAYKKDLEIFNTHGERVEYERLHNFFQENDKFFVQACAYK